MEESKEEMINKKRRARKLALQGLYQWLMSKEDIHIIESQHCEANNMARVDAAYFHRLLKGVTEACATLDASFEPFLDRPFNALTPVELSLLRLGAFELWHCPDVPYRVVLNESINLAKTFGTDDGYRYVNGILHQLACKARPIELGR